MIGSMLNVVRFCLTVCIQWYRVLPKMSPAGAIIFTTNSGLSRETPTGTPANIVGMNSASVHFCPRAAIPTSLRRKTGLGMVSYGLDNCFTVKTAT